LPAQRCHGRARLRSRAPPAARRQRAIRRGAPAAPQGSRKVTLGDIKLSGNGQGRPLSAAILAFNGCCTACGNDPRKSNRMNCTLQRRPHHGDAINWENTMIRTKLAALATATALSVPTFAAAQEADIVDTAIAAGDFETLVAAVQAAGLVETLKGEGPFTVFAPTDAAFDALPEGTVESLLEDTDALTEILTYHVVPGAVMSGDLSDGMMAATVEGSEVDISITDGTVMVDGATVTAADIEASNGVIHVIDAVIMPGDM
jgi:uncharacterized surface protein with fasciclin (FAS1) repeats